VSVVATFFEGLVRRDRDGRPCLTTNDGATILVQVASMVDGLQGRHARVTVEDLGPHRLCKQCNDAISLPYGLCATCADAGGP